MVLLSLTLDLHKECPVCQDDFVEGVETIVLPCKHIFHPDCILNWLKLNGTCPVCRLSLVDPPPSAPINLPEQPEID